jgi:hypothetical protein
MRGGRREWARSERSRKASDQDEGKILGTEGRPLVEACGNHCDTVDGGTGYSASTHAGKETKPLLGAVFEFMSTLPEKVRALEARVEVENAKGL